MRPAPFYTSLDSLSSGEIKRQDIHFDPVPQPESPDLFFVEIEEMNDWESVDGQCYYISLNSLEHCDLMKALLSNIL